MLIAKIILDVGGDAALCMDSAADRVSLAEQFALALAETNPAFDHDRFIAAATTAEDREEAKEDQYA